MKKVTKFLSILLLVAMCMSLFGGSAYAVELEGGNTSSSAATIRISTAAAAAAVSALLSLGTVPQNRLKRHLHPRLQIL